MRKELELSQLSLIINVRYGHSKVIEKLVKKGGDVMMPNKFGMTPLHHGAVHGGKDVLKALLDAGADPNKADDAGRLPLHWTATKVCSKPRRHSGK